MSDEPDSRWRNSRLGRRLRRIFLRMLPFVAGPEIYDLIQELRESRSSLDRRVREASKSLRDTAGVIADLEEELDRRREKVEALKEKSDRYSRLADVEEERAEAVLEEIERSTSQDRGKEVAVNLTLNILAGLIVFFLGVLARPWLTSLLGIGSN